MRWIDTNAFLRFITGDDPVKAAASRTLFLRIRDGLEDVTTSEAIIAEVVFVLQPRRHYGLTHTEIQRRLIPLITLRGLRLPHRQLHLRALDVFPGSSVLDFEDALSVAYMEKGCVSEIYSYDSDFDHVAGIARLEP